MISALLLLAPPIAAALRLFSSQPAGGEGTGGGADNSGPLPRESDDRDDDGAEAEGKNVDAPPQNEEDSILLQDEELVCWAWPRDFLRRGKEVDDVASSIEHTTEQQEAPDSLPHTSNLSEDDLLVPGRQLRVHMVLSGVEGAAVERERTNRRGGTWLVISAPRSGAAGGGPKENEDGLRVHENPIISGAAECEFSNDRTAEQVSSCGSGNSRGRSDCIFTHHRSSSGAAEKRTQALLSEEEEDEDHVRNSGGPSGGDQSLIAMQTRPRVFLRGSGEISDDTVSEEDDVSSPRQLVKQSPAPAPQEDNFKCKSIPPLRSEDEGAQEQLAESIRSRATTTCGPGRRCDDPRPLRGFAPRPNLPRRDFPPGRKKVFYLVERWRELGSGTGGAYGRTQSVWNAWRFTVSLAVEKSADGVSVQKCADEVLLASDHTSPFGISLVEVTYSSGGNVDGGQSSDSLELQVTSPLVQRGRTKIFDTSQEGEDESAEGSQSGTVDSSPTKKSTTTSTTGCPEQQEDNYSCSSRQNFFKEEEGETAIKPVGIRVWKSLWDKLLGGERRKEGFVDLILIDVTRVAVKELSCSNSESRDRVLREVAVNYQFNLIGSQCHTTTSRKTSGNDSIAKMYDSIEVGNNAESNRFFSSSSRKSTGTALMAMEYCGGGELFYYLRDFEVRCGGPLPIALVAAIVSQLLEALAFMHGRGLVHRDVKPENMMLLSKVSNTATRRNRKFNEDAVEDFPEIRVIDFGFAACAGAQGFRSGTREYMAPEVLRGDGRRELTINTRRRSAEVVEPLPDLVTILPAHDLWAAGCLLCLLLTPLHFVRFGKGLGKQSSAALGRSSLCPPPVRVKGGESLEADTSCDHQGGDHESANSNNTSTLALAGRRVLKNNLEESRLAESSRGSENSSSPSSSSGGRVVSSSPVPELELNSAEVRSSTKKSTANYSNIALDSTMSLSSASSECLKFDVSRMLKLDPDFRSFTDAVERERGTEMNIAAENPSNFQMIAALARLTAALLQNDPEQRIPAAEALAELRNLQNRGDNLTRENWKECFRSSFEK